MRPALFLFVLLATLSLTALGQGFLTAAIDSGATASDTLTVPSGYYIRSIVFPASFSDTVSVKCGIAQSGALYQLYNSDGTAYRIVSSVAKINMVPLVDDALYGVRYVSFEVNGNWENTSDKTIIVLLVPK